MRLITQFVGLARFDQFSVNPIINGFRYGTPFALITIRSRKPFSIADCKWLSSSANESAQAKSASVLLLKRWVKVELEIFRVMSSL